MCIECDTLVENCACKVCPKEDFFCSACDHFAKSMEVGF